MLKMPKKLLFGTITLVIIVLAGIGVFVLNDNLQDVEKEGTMVSTKETGVQPSVPTKTVDKHEEKPKKPIENELVGISLGDNLGKILDSKGLPKKQNDQDLSKVLVYDGFVVTLGIDTVVKVSITGGDISTPRGLKLNDEVDRIIELYGPSDYGTQTGDDSSGQWFYHYAMGGWELVIQTCEEGYVWGIWIEKEKD